MKDKAAEIHLFNRAMIRLRMLEEELGVDFIASEHDSSILVYEKGGQFGDDWYLGLRYSPNNIEISKKLIQAL